VSRITIFSRQGCHLCAEAEAIVRRVAGAGDVVEVVDIDADPALTDAYTVRVPVVAVDGAEVAQYQLDEGMLRACLAAT
jgi:glutaredoxin